MLKKNVILVFVFILIFNRGFAQNSFINDSVYVEINDSLTRAYKPTQTVYFLNDKPVSEYRIMKMLFEGKKITGSGYPDKRTAIKMYGEKYRHGILFLFFDEKTGDSEEYFDLIGQIDNKFNNKIIMLFTFENNNLLSIDTTIIRNGSFHFHGKEYKEEFSLLSVGNWPEDEIRSIDVVLEKGNINVNMSDSTKRIAGTSLNDLYQSYFDSTKVYLNEIKKLCVEQGNEQIIAGSPLEKKWKELGYFSVNFKKKNISNIIGQELFRDEQGKHMGELIAFGNNFAFQMIIDSATEEYKIKNKEWIEQISSSLRKDEESAIGKNKLLNTVYTDFEFQTIDGESKRLSDYVGKSEYLLIDFWASWCAPCIADMPHLKELYNQYKEKGIEIISISLDDSKAAWQKGLNKINTPWIHLCDFKGNRSPLAEAYHIYGIPYCLLLNNKGEIIWVNSIEKTLDDCLQLLME